MTGAPGSDADERLELYAYPAPAPVEHGTLLTLLFHLQHDEYFCFADSDVLARGRFDRWLESELDHADAVGSCSALLWEDLPASAGFLGRCAHTPAGTPNLGSYFAVYRRKPVARIMKETGIGFEKRIHPQHLNRFERDLADGGRLVRRDVRYRKSPGLRPARTRSSSGTPQRPQLAALGGLSWSLWRRQGRPDAPGCSMVLRGQDLEAGDEDDLDAVYQRRKEAGAAWFAANLYHLFGRAPQPDLAVSDDGIRSCIVDACEEIRRAFHYVGQWRT